MEGGTSDMESEKGGGGTTGGRKRPLVAVVLSFVLPGLGQIYTDQNAKGVTIILLNFVINYLLLDPVSRLDKATGADRRTLVLIVGAYVLAGLVLWIYSMVDAKLEADRINAARSEDQSV